MAQTMLLSLLLSSPFLPMFSPAILSSMPGEGERRGGVGDTAGSLLCTKAL